MKKSLKIILVGLLVCCVLLIIGINLYYDNEWKWRTTPLPQTTVEELCDLFDLSNTDKLCDMNHDIYALDFYDFVGSYFWSQNDLGGLQTFSDVEEKIGDFQIECDPISPAVDSFSCAYDFRGDHIFLLWIEFELPNKTIRNMRVPMGYD